MTTDATKPNYFGMSDEDFINSSAPPSQAAVVAEPSQQETAGSSAVDEDNKESDDGSAADGTADSGDDNGDGSDISDVSGVEKDADDKDEEAGSDDKSVPAAAAVEAAPGAGAGDKGADPAKAAPAGSEQGKPEGDKKPEAEAAKPAEVNYENFFKQIMTPFKANGRTVELKTPEEAIRLMQMGAGYGKKIQDMQPHLKVLRLLEKNDLLDQGKLGFLIDVNSKNPDAIKKLIKDSGIDPLDLNTDDNVSYVPTTHVVSDEEMSFQDALSNVQQHPTGAETLRVINQTWDHESKSVLWESPQILEVIQSQRENGVYDQIVTEIDRQKLLGKIPHSTSFLKAYKLAGDSLMASTGVNTSDAGQQIQTQPAVQPQPQVIATRVGAPKATVANGDKAAAAAATKSSGKGKGGATVNPLEMADDDFLKQFNGRL